MSAEQNRKIVEDAVAEWRAGNPEAFYKILDDDVLWTVIGSTEVSGTYTSRQAFIDGAVRKIGNRVDGQVKPEIVDIVTEGDRLVFRDVAVSIPGADAATTLSGLTGCGLRGRRRVRWRDDVPAVRRTLRSL